MKPSQLAATLPRILNIGRTPFIWGDPGVGKSDIVRQVAKDAKIELVDMRLSLFDPTGLQGFPTLRGTGKNERMHFIPSSMLPSKGKGILFLDELPGAAPAVQMAAYQLILDRALGEYTLPEGWHIVAAGNYARNGGVHYAPPPALANRFIHVDLECSQTEWDHWAAANDITPETRAFLRFRPALIHDIEARKSGVAFPSPRTWKFADDIAKESFDTLSEMELLKGTVGEGAAAEYLAFIKTARELPTFEQIEKSPTTAAVPANAAAKHAVTALLESRAEASNLKAIFQYVARLEVEFQVAFVNGITRHKRALATRPEYRDWCVANSDALRLY